MPSLHFSSHSNSDGLKSWLRTSSWPQQRFGCSFSLWQLFSISLQTLCLQQFRLLVDRCLWDSSDVFCLFIVELMGYFKLSRSLRGKREEACLKKGLLCQGFKGKAALLFAVVVLRRGCQTSMWPLESVWSCCMPRVSGKIKAMSWIKGNESGTAIKLMHLLPWQRGWKKLGATFLPNLLREDQLHSYCNSAHKAKRNLATEALSSYIH